ncbi:MAG: peptidase signal peptidase [Clostridiaceae bacterium]|jgi:signal peptidase|nr:peptidase signal peptidase [Clostridiaceae bacterium]
MRNTNNYLPTRTTYKKSIYIIILFLSIYIIDNSSIKTIIDGYLFTYLIKPILWISIATIIWRMPHIKSTAKLKHRKFIYFWACIFGVTYILITIFAGFFDGIGKSPYSHTPKGIITNIIFIGSSLVGREFIRSYLINSFTKKESYTVFIIIALLMTITNFSVNKYIELNSLENFVKFGAEYFAPEFSHNLFTSYLVYLGGPFTSIIYLGTIQGFHWLSPILPNLKWIITALIGILCPIFFLMVFKSIYLNNAKEIKKTQHDKEDLVSWIVTSIISIGIIWFSVGVFPIYPSVIATGSMEPEIKPGDIILVEKITEEEEINNLKVNDVIQFHSDGILISHRIIQIKKDDSGDMLFRTKGDNNSGVDADLVKPKNIKGKIKYVVPKIGWLTLLIKSEKDLPLDEIVF